MTEPAPLLLVAMILLGAQDPEPRLVFDELVEGVIEDGAPVVETETLVTRYAKAPVLGHRFRFELDKPGPVTIELRSYFFDAYLVLRDDRGGVLAEDDDGLLGTHARLVLAELEAGRTYGVDACALHGQRGPFELVLKRGEPAGPTSAATPALELDDAERRAAAIERAKGPDSIELAAALNELGSLHYRRGDLEQARPRFERALALWEACTGPERAFAATALNNLGALHGSRRDFAAAVPLLERAVEIAEEELGPEHPTTSVSVSNLAEVHTERGDLSAARPLHERAVADLRRSLGPEHPSTLLTLNRLATLYERQGDYAAARPLLEQTLAVRERVLGPEHPSIAQSLNDLAVLLRLQGDLAAARPLYERALSILEDGSNPRSTATLLNNLAELTRALGDPVTARSQLEHALAIQERSLDPDHPDTARTLNNLALLLQAQGEPASARSLHERALAIRERALGPEHSATAISLGNLAMVLVSQGDHATARARLERALAIMEQALGPEHPTTGHFLNNMALLLVNLGETDAAWDRVGHAHRNRSIRLAATLASMSEGERYPYLAGLAWQLELQLSLAREVENRDAGVDAYESLLDWKGRVGRLLTASREQLAARMGDQPRALVEALRRSQVELSRLALETEIRDRAAHDLRLAELRSERGRLERELERQLGPLLQGTDAADLRTLRARLEPRSALVDFFVHRVYRPGAGEPGAWSSPRLSAWITRADRERLVELDLGPAASVGEAVRSFLEDLVRRRGVASAEARDAKSGTALRERLWDPIAPHLEGIDTVFVSPDGVLGTLPFETLPLADGSLALERFAFVYVPDAKSLTRSEGIEGEFRSILSVGGVDYRESSDWDLTEASLDSKDPVATANVGPQDDDLRGSFTDYWGRLPATEYESQVAFDMHEDAFGGDGRRLLLQGCEPSEERLKYELERHSVLHLATHGYFQPEGMPSMWEAAKDEAGRNEMRMSGEARHLVGKHPGLLSGLVCAGANRGSDPDDDEGDDGYLTAEEVGWLDLSGVELVVLSACETGLGRPQSGEGLIGLRRAFQTAGAKTVISSLWSVKDESTAELMRDFYKNLFLKGMGRHEALRSAQLAMLQRNRMEHGEALPSTWGAFVLSGEWR